MVIVLCLLGIFIGVSVIGGGYDIIVLLFSPDRPINGYFMKIAAYVLDRLGFLGAFLPFFAIMYVITVIVCSAHLDTNKEDESNEAGKILVVPLLALIIGFIEYFPFANFLTDTPFGAFTSGAAGVWVFSNASITHQWIAAVVCTICLPGSILFMLFKMLQVSGVLRKALFLFLEICDFIKEKLPKTKKQLEREAAMRKAEEERRFQEELKEQERVREEIRRRDEQRKFEEEQKRLREEEERKKPKKIDGNWHGHFSDVLAGRIPVDSFDCHHDTALMFAVEHGYAGDVKKLISMGADVNVRNNSEQTPLIYATKSGSAAAGENLANIVQALLDAGADPDAFDRDGKTALSQCLERKTLEAADILLQRVKHFSEISACELLKSAAQYEKDVSFLKFLLEHHFPVNAKDRNGGNVLFEPCISAEAVSILVRAGADVNAVDKDGHNCLYNTIFANAVKALTEAGADPNIGMSWQGYNNPAILEVLIDAGAYVNDINEKGRTALIKIVETDSPDKKDIAEVYLLLKAGTKPNTKLVKQERDFNSDKETALDFALWLPRWGEHWYEASELILRMLLKKGAKPKNDIHPEQKTYIQKALNKNRKSDPMKEAKEIFEKLKEKNPYWFSPDDDDNAEDDESEYEDDELEEEADDDFDDADNEDFYDAEDDEDEDTSDDEDENDDASDDEEDSEYEDDADDEEEDEEDSEYEKDDADEDDDLFNSDYDDSDDDEGDEDTDDDDPEEDVSSDDGDEEDIDADDRPVKKSAKNFSYGEIKQWFDAVEDDDLDVIEDMVTQGIDVDIKNEDGESALFIASENGQEKIVSALIKAGADVNSKNEGDVTPLMAAMRNTDEKEIVKALVEAGADIEAKDEDGDTVLQYAFDVDCVQEAIKAGADIHTKNNNNETLLMNACSAEYAQFLIDKGLDVNATDNDDDTPLTSCVSARFKDNPEGELETLFILLNAGAKVDAADCNGDTALMTLAELSRFKRPIEFTKKAIKALLDAGADPRRENKKGKSALSIAEKAGNADIIKMLAE